MSWSDWQQVEGDGLDFEEILYEKKIHAELEGGVARVTFNKPEKYNSMTLHTVDEMFRAFYDANHDTSIGVIIVAGAGKHFGAGGDVEWEKWGLREAFYNRYPHNRLIRISRKPVIAAVQGYCLGGHNHMAYCCDFTIAADSAVFGQAGPKVSSPADGFFVPYLTKVVGAKKAREMWMLCRRYPAAEAKGVDFLIPHANAASAGGYLALRESGSAVRTFSVYKDFTARAPENIIGIYFNDYGQGLVNIAREIRDGAFRPRSNIVFGVGDEDVIRVTYSTTDIPESVLAEVERAKIGIAAGEINTLAALPKP